MVNPQSLVMPSKQFREMLRQAAKANEWGIKNHELLENARKLQASPEIMRQATLSPDHARTLVAHVRGNQVGGKQLLGGSAARLSLEIARRHSQPKPALGLDLSDLSKSLAVLYESIDARTEGIRKTLAGHMDSIEAYRPLFEQMQQAANAFIEGQRALDERADDFVERHGWPVPLRLQPKLFSRIVRRADASKREVNALMTSTFSPGSRAHAMTRAVLLESPHFGSRKALLRQAMKALGRQEWYLVINALLPLVEGVLVDVVFANEPAPKKGRAQKSVKELQEVKDEVFYAPLARGLEVMLLPPGAGVALFDKFELPDYGRPGEPRSLNRNAILHGAARRYGSQQNALKLYLLLVMMAELLEGFEKRRTSKTLKAGS